MMIFIIVLVGFGGVVLGFIFVVVSIGVEACVFGVEICLGVFIGIIGMLVVFNGKLVGGK